MTKDVRIQSRFNGRSIMVYVRLSHPPRVFLAGDYLEITDKLSSTELEKFVKSAKRKAWRL